MIINKDNIDFDKISNLIVEGSTFCYPTDTLYGLGCKYDNKASIEKIISLKGRNKNHFFSLLFKDLDMLDYFFRDWRENKTIKMDRGVIKNFLKVCESLLGSDRELQVDITSGFRTKKTNEKLRRNSYNVAKNSMHLVGRAIDFRIRDRSISNLEEAAEKLTPGGLGIYSAFIHIDTGPYRRWKA